MTMLTFNEYQERARTTAVYPNEHAVIYPVLGLISELGELAALFKRCIRDKALISRESLRAEFGDIAWYIAALASDLECDLDDWYREGSYSYIQGRADKPEIAVADFCGEITEWAVAMLYRSGANSKDGERGLHDWRELLYRAPEVLTDWVYMIECYGFAIEEVLQRNLDKLADRASRGVLRGEGDKR